MTTQGAADVAADWKPQLRDILSQDGITHLAPIAAWKFYSKFAALALLALVALFVGPDLVDGWLGPVVSGLLFALFGVVGLDDKLLWHIYKQKTRSVRNALQTLERAKRPPILLLRSFAFDPKSHRPARTDLFEKFLTIEWQSYEDRLVLALRRFAPVLAIGRPGEFEPPFGAATTPFYARHEVWQDTIARMIPLTSLVVWSSGHTEGLRWELGELLRVLPPHRLLVWVHAHVSGPPADVNKTWQEVLKSFGGMFPKPLPDDVRAIRFFAFADDWTPVPVPGPRYPRKNGDTGDVAGLRAYLTALFAG